MKDPDERLAVGWTTVEDAVSAEHLAHNLLESGLAACVQIDRPIKSLYRWKGGICVEEETRLWIKTTESCARRVGRYLEEHHPYETPQWVWSVLDGGSGDYAHWVRESVGR